MFYVTEQKWKGFPLPRSLQNASKLIIHLFNERRMVNKVSRFSSVSHSCTEWSLSRGPNLNLPFLFEPFSAYGWWNDTINFGMEQIRLPFRDISVARNRGRGASRRELFEQLLTSLTMDTLESSSTPQRKFRKFHFSLRILPDIIEISIFHFIFELFLQFSMFSSIFRYFFFYFLIFNLSGIWYDSILFWLNFFIIFLETK